MEWRGIYICSYIFINIINILYLHISNYGNFRIKFKTRACLILETATVVERKEMDSKKYCELIFNKSKRHTVVNNCCSKKKKIPNQNKTLNLYLMLSKIWLKIDHRYKYMQNKCKNIKLPEENIGVNLCNLG